MKLYRRTNAVYRGNICPGDFEQNFQPGKIYSEDAIPDYLTAEQVAELFEYIGDGPPDPPNWASITKPKFVEYVQTLHAWIIGPVAQQLRQNMILSPMFDSGPVEVTLPGLVLPLMKPLRVAASRVDVPGRILPSELPADMAHTLGMLNDILEWAGELANQNEQAVLADSEPAPPRLSVSVERKTVTLDGIEHDVSSENALRWVKVLADHPEEWISSTELKQYDPLLDGIRPDRVKQFLPDGVVSLIDSDRRKGSRLRST